jgi:hypothetical protein
MHVFLVYNKIMELYMLSGNEVLTLQQGYFSYPSRPDKIK